MLEVFVAVLSREFGPPHRLARTIHADTSGTLPMPHAKNLAPAAPLGRFKRWSNTAIAIALLALGLAQPALAASTGTWTATANGGTATMAGVTVTMSGVTTQNLPPSAATMNPTNFWADPYGSTVAGAPAIFIDPSPYGTTQTVTITFSKPINNPVLHVDRLAGTSGTNVSTTTWNLSSFAAIGGSVTPSLLGGNSQFILTGNTFQRATSGTQTTGACVAGDNTSAGCGSVLYTGTGITRLTFTVSWAGTANGTVGDGINFLLSMPDTKVVIRKQSIGGTSTFAFTGTNGVAAASLNTGTANPAASAASTIPNITQPVTITETVTAPYTLTSTSCLDQKNVVVASTTAGSTLTLAAAALGGGGQTITCTFVNSAADMSIDLSALPKTATVGTPYSGTFTCSNAAAPVLGATAATCAVSGLPAGLTTSCAPTPPVAVAPGASITCTVSGTPTALGASTLSGTTGASNDANAANNTATTTITAVGSDMQPDLTGLPATATVGTFYSGTVKCTNSATATASATAATCTVSGLPPGVTVGVCTPTPPATVAAGASISCAVSGTPTAPGSATVTATTGATNDGNGGTTAGGNNTATKAVATAASDMSISLSGLPTTGSIGVPYTGTFTCTNAAAPALAATNATCALAGLPAGLTTTCSPTVPAASLAPSAVITCTVSGTPTAVGSSALTGSTNAGNDGNAANNAATTTLAITGSDMTPDLSGLPVTATAGVPYSGTVKCTNNAAATASATNATCAITGLPAGVAVGTCTPTPPATVAAGASVSCVVSGIPTASGSATVSATTGATNDTNGGTTAGGNNTATQSVAVAASDMSISLAGLPTTASVGVPYSGTFTCTNAASPAIAATSATCAVTGLPAGLSTSCAPTPPTTVAPSAAITCTVSGTPTTVGSSNLSGTTGATNDPVIANNTATTSITATGSDMQPDLTGLPATATVGTAYAGTIKCTNSATATASATNATCSVSGLPPGVTVGTCVPAPPTTVAAGDSISCPVSGTPTAPGAATVTASTGATNDINGGTTGGGNNTATKPVAVDASDMSINLSGLPTTVVVGVPYTGSFTCSNAASPAITATAASCSVTGLPAGLTFSCAPATPTSVAPGATITCSVTGTPTTPGSSTVAGTTGATNDGNSANNTATTTLGAVGSDMVPDLSGLPATATVGTAYAGTIKCTNSASASASAINASCSVSGLPPGVTVGTCVPAPPATVAAGASISCPVTGTPTAPGSSTVTATTGATNDVNGGTTTGGNNQLTKSVAVDASDMSIDLTGLPTTLSVGTPYSGTFVCKNGASPLITATAASCAVTGLPAGLSTSCTPVLPASVAPGAQILCTVTGTPTTPGTSTVNGTTGASNDGNAGNNTATATLTTTGSDMQPDISGLPLTATVGTAYSGTIKCTNNATATAGAASATCAVTGLPPGVTVGTCTPAPPATVAAGTSISCPVSGTPTASGSTTVTVTTGATNDVNGQAANGGNNQTTASIAVSGSDMRIDLSGVPTTLNVGVPYTGTFTCTNAASPAITATAAACGVSGLPAGLTTSCTPTPPATVAPGAQISCAVTGTPTTPGSSTVNGTTGAANDPNIANNTATTTLATNGSDMTPDLSGLPATATVGALYTGTVTCTNNAAATATALNATCSVTGLPAGVTVGTCTPTTPASVAPGGTISCPVSGTPTTTGSNTVTATTGATNDTNGGTTTGGNNQATTSIAVGGSDMSIDMSGLPTLVGIGQPYTGTYTCTNAATAAASAIAATCALSALPPGLSASCAPSTPTTVAPGASIVCTVTGTPTANGSTTVPGTTGATNDGNPSNNTASIDIAVTDPILSFAKSTTSTGFTAPGVSIPFSYRVTNGGPVTLFAAITVADTKIPTISCPALPGTGLAPGAFITCTASYLTTQADVDAGVVTNTAAAKSGVTLSPSDSVTVPATRTPSISLLKGTAATGFAAAGTTVTYTYQVTNTGNTTLTTPVTISDNKIASVTCPALPAGGLTLGNSITCSGVYTISQADMDAGSVTNIASAASGALASNTSSVTLNAMQSSALTLLKTSATTSFTAPGVSIPYNFKVTNAGNVTLTSAITVTDPKVPAVSCPALPAGGLAPAAFITCTGSYTTTQADVDAGGVSNTASAQSGLTTSPTSIFTINASQFPALTVLKTSTTSSFSAPGVSIPYSYRVTNAGNVTLTSTVTVTDNKIASVTCPSIGAGLAPGAFITCTGSYLTTQADVDAGGVTNAASSKSGTTTSPTVTLPIPATQTPSIGLTKTASPTTFTAPGVAIAYTYVVRNTGNTTIPASNAVTVADNKIASVSCPSIPVGGLAPNATLTCTASTITTQADVDAGSIVNIASATAGALTSPNATATATATQTPALKIVKDTTTASISAVGVSVPYTFVVTNAGNTTLTAAVTVTDNKIATVTCPALPAGGLAPNASITCTGSYTTTQADLDAGSVVNTAVAKSGTVTSPGGSHTLPASQNHGLTMTKAASPTSFAATGVTISYTYVVRNTGNVTLPPATVITVSDNKLATVSCPALPATGLAPNATLTCTATYLTKQSDLDAGSITNSASATDGVATSPTVSATVTATQTPALSIVKATTTANFSATGVSVPYTFKVTNTGNITLTSAVTVTDSKIAAITCPSVGTGLTPGAFITCTGSYLTTQADLDAGSVVNTASAKSGATTSPTDSHTLPAVLAPALTLIKSSTTAAFTAPGVTISYSYKVSNSGNTTLTSAISVTDDKIASVTCPALPAGGLAPAAFITCTGSYLTTQADVDAGAITNTASAASGSVVAPLKSLTINATQTPALTVLKTSSAASFSTIGASIPYSYKVTNAGNTTLTSAIAVTDNKIASVACPALPAGGLAPAAFITCTSSYMTTQADIDNGGVTNAAFAKSGPTTTSPTVNLTVPSAQSPALTVIKSSTTSNFNAANITIPYSYLVTNTGNSTLTAAVTVADNKIASISCPSIAPGLAPGAAITCTGSYLTTQADVDAGGITNTASAKSGLTTSPATSLTINSTRTPKLSIAKSTTATTYTTLNEVIPYSFVVTNAGNTTLTAAISVSDSKIASVSCPSIGAGLIPGASITCSANYTVTQADIDGGNVLNTASAISGLITSPTVTVTLTGSQTPKLTITKSSATSLVTTLNQSITYSFDAKNTGNVTLTKPVVITDSKIGTITCPVGAGLAVNATITCTATYNATQADFDSGNVVNTATASSGTATTTVGSNTVGLTIPVDQKPQLTLAKTAPPAPYATVGQTITYTFAAQNTGNVTITTPISISDDKIASVTCPALPAGGLLVGATHACSGTYTITQADLDAGILVNTATAKSGTTTSTPPTVHTQNGTQTHALTLTKTPSTSTYATVGASISYTYVVRNTGNVTIPASASVSVSDNKISSVSCPGLPAGGLAPNATLTCTAAYVITQADLDAGSVVNMATATDGTATSPQVTATVTATQAPALKIAKDTATTSFTAVNVSVPYTFVVTNTGNVTLTAAITVADTKITAVTCPPIAPGLAPGASVTCNGSYLTTQADLDAGSVVNVATAKSGTTTSPISSHSLPAAQNRALTLAKSGSPTTFAANNTTITYTYVVTNSGNITIPAASPISVTDNKLGALSCPAIPAGGLAPTQTLTCTATYATKQSDLDAGSITNVASATDGVVTSPLVSATVNAVQNPSLGVVKATTATTFSTVGQSIPYTFAVTNTGNVTMTAAVTVTDNKIASVSCPALPSAGLAPAASIACTGAYLITQADIDAGSVVNTAYAKSATTTSTPPFTHTLNGAQTPALTIQKSTTTTAFSATGVSIPYSYKVINAGNVTLSSAITVTDDKIASVTCPALPAGGLAPTQFIICTGSYLTTQADLDAGKVTNVAAASSGGTTSPTGTATVNATKLPALTLVKSTTATSFATLGGSIAYTYQVTNSGNVTLTSAITIADNKIASVACPALPAGGLVPGASLTCLGNYTITQADLDAGKVINIASASSGTATSSNATVTVNAAQTPALSVVKASTTTSFTTLGASIPYSYKVTNAGNVTLTAAITVADNKIAAMTCPALPVGGLAPQAFITCTGSYTVTQLDLDAGTITNTATASSGATTSPTTSLSINAAQAPALTIVKSSPSTVFTSAGTVIPYSYLVTNAGNVTLTSAISVTDNKIASVTCPALPAGGLAPNASITCTGTYTTGQADVDAGSVSNTASAKSGSTISPTGGLTINAAQAPGLSITKSTTTTSFALPNTSITYSYKVINSGNTTIAAPVSVFDNKIAVVTCPALPAGGLVPNAFITCTGAYATTQADLDAGGVTNIASAKSGSTTSLASNVTVPAVQAPALGISKSTVTLTFGKVGTYIPYSYRVTNLGNTTLTAALTVTDNKISSIICPALPVGGLAPNASIICTGGYLTTQADLDAGSLVNTATAASGALLSPTVNFTVIAAQSPALSLQKSSSVTTFSVLGASIPYNYKVTNTGNITITAPISVTDDKIAAITCPGLLPAGLAPNGFITCTGSYMVTQADLDAGSITNIASAKSGTLVSPPVTYTIVGTQSPALAIVKSSTATTFVIAGEVLPYSYQVTNTGNVSLLTAITVTDNKIPSVSCPGLPSGGLAPNAVITCTGTYAVTQLDLDAGSVTNTASAKSSTVSSPVVSLTINATQRPDFKIVIVTTNPNAIATNNGDGTFTGSFEIKLTNNGNVDLTNVQVIDDYLAQLPKGASVKLARLRSIVSSSRGALGTTNPLFTATATSPNLFTGSGEKLDVGEVITFRLDITFDPGPNPSSGGFGNTVVGKTAFNGTGISTTATRTSSSPLGFVANAPLIVSKVTPKTDIARGELVPYTITVRNAGDVTRTGVTLIDVMPAGFKYRVTSASIDGIAREPVINGRTLSWPNVTIATAKPLVLKLVLIAGAGIGMGEFTNEAWVTDGTGTVLSNVGRATVRMIGDPTFDCTDIIGKVFDDVDRSGYATDGKRGIANVRLVTARGQLITTDAEGRFHIACADIPESDRGTNFILKLDERTLPTGYRMTTENPRVIRITAGKMAKINFGAAITRVARLELADAAFEPGGTRLMPKWQEGLPKIFDALKQERSVLRISYRRRLQEDNALAEARVKALADAIREQWKREGTPYITARRNRNLRRPQCAEVKDCAPHPSKTECLGSSVALRQSPTSGVARRRSHQVLASGASCAPSGEFNDTGASHPRPSADANRFCCSALRAR